MKVRKKVYPSGRVKWQLDLGVIDGKRAQTYFDTKEEAAGKLADAKAKRRSHGTASLALSEADRILFCAARDKLAAVGATISAAVDYYLATRPPEPEAVRLADLLERCLAEKHRLGKATRYLQQLRCSCLSFIRGREHVHAHEILRADVKAWVHGNAWAPKTQRVYLGDLRTLFAYALEIGAARENPCNGGTNGERITLAAMVAAPISTLSVAHSKSVLSAAAREPADGAEDFRPLLAYVALGLFCGIRPAELERLDRAAVSLEERHVVVEASQSKTRRRRVVDISENCARWLTLDPTASGPVAPSNFRRRFERLRIAAGLLPPKPKKGEPKPNPSTFPGWPHDVMRHTFASMHYAAHQNESLLKAQMGHSSREEVLFRHYRALKTRAEAAAFWALVP